MRKIIAILLLCSSQVWAESITEGNWNFMVLVDDREVGKHNFSVKAEQNGWLVNSTMALDFKILLIKKITYQHEATEQWQDGCLTQVSSRTKRQSKEVTTQASLTESGLMVVTADGDEILEGCVRSFAYWNPQLLQGERLLNVETGGYLPVKISSEVAPENSHTHVTIAGSKINIQLEYDTTGDWIGLQTKLKTGAVLKYQRI
jgi:hypothetical protein